MSTPQTRITQTVLKILQESGGRSLSLRALCTYTVGRSGIPLSVDELGVYLDDLIAKGYAARTAHPLNPSDTGYCATPSGNQVHIPADV